MKLSHYAKQQDMSARTAWRWWQAGLIPGFTHRYPERCIWSTLASYWYAARNAAGPRL